MRIPNAAAQTLIISVARIRVYPRKSARAFKGIICADVSEFESSHPSHAVRSPWRTNNDPRANVPTGGRVAWSQPLAGRPTMAEGERPHRGFLFALKMRPTTTPVASTSKSSSFHSLDGWLADARLRISEDMELACCNASARSTALSEPNDELSVITTNRAA